MSLSRNLFRTGAFLQPAFHVLGEMTYVAQVLGSGTELLSFRLDACVTLVSLFQVKTDRMVRYHFCSVLSELLQGKDSRKQTRSRRSRTGHVIKEVVDVKYTA